MPGEDSALLSPEAPPSEQVARLSMPTIRGGLNGSIADILEASGYGTETDFKVDDEIGYVFTEGRYNDKHLMLCQSQ